MALEHKTVAFELTSSADDILQGQIKGYCAVLGNVDDGDDRILLGAFAKSINERLGRIKVGWQHDLDYPLAKTTLAREVPRAELPQAILDRAPDAKGGLYVEGQASLTATNLERLQLMKDGVVDELSIGYLPVQAKQVKDASLGRYVRELSEVKWFEWSPVTIAMNAAARITSVKSADDGNAGIPISDSGTHGAFTGSHAHAHAANGAQGEDDTHGHRHSHNGDGDHGHPHGKAARPALYRKAVGDSQTYIRQRLQDALSDAYPHRSSYDFWGAPAMQADPDGPGCCIQDIYADAVIVNDQDFDAYWEIPYTMAPNGNITLGAPQLVKIVYQPVSVGSEEALETAAAALALSTKAGRRNSSADTGLLKAAHDSLHTVLNMPHHELDGSAPETNAPAESDAPPADAKASADTLRLRLKVAESRARVANLGAA